MPDRYANLSKEDLVSAFLSCYYELLINCDDDRTITLVANHMTEDIRNEDDSNEILWKKLWFSYIAYFASLHEFHSLKMAANKEIVLADEVTDEEYAEFIAMSDLCYRVYVSEQKPLCPSTRLYMTLKKRWMDAIKWNALADDVKRKIDNRIGKEIRALVPIKPFYRNSPYFDRAQTIYDWVEIFVNADVRQRPDFEKSFKHIYHMNDHESISKITAELKTIIKEAKTHGK